MRRTKEDAEKTRLAILEAAERLFLERGVAHTSLDVIAREAGVTRGAVYWHFQNKAHLFHEMLSQVRLPPEQLTERLCHCGNDDPLRSTTSASRSSPTSPRARNAGGSSPSCCTAANSPRS